MKKLFIMATLAVAAIVGFALQLFPPPVDVLAFLPNGDGFFAPGILAAVAAATAFAIVIASITGSWWPGIARSYMTNARYALAAVGKSFAQAHAVYHAFTKQAVDKVRMPYPLTSLRC